MPLTVETGAPNQGNTFIDVAFLDEYLSDRGYSIDVAKEPLLFRSYDVISRLNWIQSHAEAFDVTDQMKKAQAEIAYQMSLGFVPESGSVQKIKKEKVDVLETEYFETDLNSGIDLYPTAKSYISDLIHDGSASSSNVGNVELI